MSYHRPRILVHALMQLFIGWVERGIRIMYHFINEESWQAELYIYLSINLWLTFLARNMISGMSNSGTRLVQGTVT